jgi:hypothetical protein
MSCKIIYKGSEFTRKELNETLENEMLSKAEASLSDFRLSERDAVISKRFGLTDMGNGSYIANQQQLESLDRWKQRAFAPEFNVFSKEIIAENGGKYHVVNFTTPEHVNDKNFQKVFKSKGITTEAEVNSEDTINSLMEQFSKVFPGMKHVFVNPEDLNQDEHFIDTSKIKSFVKDDVAFFVRGRVTTDTALEEILHPFINTLYDENRSLFNDLLRSGKKENPEFFAYISDLYKDAGNYTTTDVNKEFVTQMLQMALSEEIEADENEISPAYKNIVQKFLQWIKDLFENIMRTVSKDKTRVLDIQGMSTAMSFKDIAVLLNTKEVEVKLNFKNDQGKVFYSISSANIEDANEMLQNQPDQKIKNSPLTKQLASFKNQAITLNRAHSRANVKQRDILEKLQAMTEDLLGVVSENIRMDEESPGSRMPSVTVSNLTGYSEFESKKDYTAFQEFGNLIGAALEELQIKAFESNTSMHRIFSEEWFTDFVENRLKEDNLKENGNLHKLFEIEGMESKELFKMMEDMVNALGAYSNVGNILLPELTVLGKNHHGMNILGRIDLFIIDDVGETHILDFKTKKVRSLVQYDKVSKTKEHSMNRVKVELASKTRLLNGSVSGTAEQLSGLARNTQDVWMTQLMAYDYLLRQYNIPVSAKHILGLMYQTDADNKKVEGWGVQTYSGNFYGYVDAYIAQPVGPNRIDYLEMGMERYEEIERALAANIPLSEEQSKFKDNSKPRYTFNMTEARYEKMKIEMLSVIENNLKDSYKRRSELRSRKINSTGKTAEDLEREQKLIDDQIEMLNRRINTLRSFETITKLDENVMQATKIRFVIESIQEDLDNVFDSWSSMTDVDSFTKQNAARMYHEMLKNMKPVLSMLNAAMLEMIRNKELDEKSHLYEAIKKMQDGVSAIQGQYTKYSIDVVAEMVFKTLSPETFKGVSDDMKLALEPMIAKLKNDIEAIQSGNALSLVNQWWLKLQGYMGRKEIERFSKDLDPAGQKAIAILDVLHHKLQRHEHMLKFGETYSIENIKEFLDAATNPSSIIYMGMSDSNLQNILSVNLDRMVASAGNSDLLLHSYVNFLKTETANATNTMQNLFAEKDIQTKMDKARKGMSQEAFNEKLTEVVQVLVYENGKVKLDNDGNPVTRSELRMVHPASQKYVNRFKDHQNNFKILTTEISEKKSEYKNERDAVKANKIQKEVLELIHRRERIVEDFIKWKHNNASSKTVRAFDEINNMVPIEVRDELAKIRLEIEKLQYTLLFAESMKEEGSDDDITEPETHEQIEQLFIQMRTIRAEAASTDEYKAYLNAIDMYYGFDNSDWSNYEAARKREKIKFGEDVEALKKWEDENLVTTATEDYKLERERIFLEIERITGGMDQALKDLYDQKRAIVNIYKIDGVFKPHLLSFQHRSELDYLTKRIEETMEQIRSEGNVFDSYDEVQAEELKALFTELSEISKDILNPEYLKMRRAKEDTLFRVKALKDRSQAELLEASKDTNIDPAVLLEIQENYAMYEKQFNNEELQFREWFNSHHDSVYTSVYDNPNISYSKPKLFLYEKAPMHAKHIERRPVSKWTKRKILDAAYNTEYQELMDGTPLPLGFQMVDDRVSIIPGYKFTEEQKENINPRFLELMSDESMFDFYTTFMDMFLGMQKKIKGKSIGYTVPGAKATSMQNIFEKGFIGGLKGEAAKIKDNMFTLSISQADLVENTYGDSKEAVGMRFNKQYDGELQSKDAVSSVFKWLYEAHVNEAMSYAQSTAMITIDMVNSAITELAERDPIANEKRINDLKNLSDMLNFEMKKFVQGATEAKVSRVTKKTVDMVMKIASFGRMGYDVVGQLKNYVSGNVQAFIAADSNGHYSVANYLWAKGQIYNMNGFLGKYIGDWGKVGNLSKETMLYRLFNPAQKDYVKYLNMTSGSKGRRLAEKMVSFQELAYALQDKGDTEIAMTVWLSIMDSYKFNVMTKDASGNWTQKLDENGHPELVRATEAYALNDKGQLVIREDVQYTAKDEQRLRNIVYSEIRRAQGNYAKSDMAEAERTIIGRMMFYFKKYLVPQIVNRVGVLRPNWEGEEAAMGYWRAMIAVARLYSVRDAASFLLVGGISKKMAQKLGSGTVNEFYATKAAHASRDFMASIILVSLSIMALGLVKQRQEDDEELGMMEGALVRLIWGIKAETTSLTPIPGLGSGDEYIRNFSTITSLAGDATKLYRSIQHALALAVIIPYGDEGPDAADHPILSTIYEKNIYQRKEGPFEEGSAKIKKDLYDMSGLKNFHDLFFPDYRVKQMSKRE